MKTKLISKINSWGLPKAILPLQRQMRENVWNHSWFTEIDQHLYLGGALTTPKDYQWLLDEEISAVLNMCAEYKDDEDILGQHGISYLNISVNDFTSPTVMEILYGVEFIKTQINSQKKVLVHCAKGRGRSATVACAYLMKNSGMRFNEAEKKLKLKRELVSILPEQSVKLLEIEDIQMSSKKWKM